MLDEAISIKLALAIWLRHACYMFVVSVCDWLIQIVDMSQPDCRCSSRAFKEAQACKLLARVDMMVKKRMHRAIQKVYHCCGYRRSDQS